MTNRILIVASAIGLAAMSWVAPVTANPDEKAPKAGIEVIWGDFDKYRDVRAAREPKGSFHKRVKNSFEKFFNEYSENLPEGQSLTVEITELDLAGHVLFGLNQDIRIMKDVHFPRMAFNYSLTDADGKVLKQGEAQLKDMNYLYHEKTWKRYSQGFYYEKRMFREWFEDTISKS